MDTSTYENTDLENIIRAMRTGRETYRPTNNIGGGANFTYVESLVELARQVRRNTLTLEEAKKVARENW